MIQTVLTIVTIIGGYLLLYALEFVSRLLFQFPVMLDQGQRQSIERLQAETTPRPDPQEDHRLRYVSERLSGCSDEGLRLLSWLVTHGETEEIHFCGSGMTREAISEVMRIGRQHQI